METRTFRYYYLKTVTSPQEAFENLIADRKMLKYATYAVLITSILYTFVYVFLIFGGGQPFKPWLNIPLEDYYKYNVFFCAPSMFLGWILAAGVMQTVTRIFSERGSFEQALSVLGFSISIASWATGIHDIITSFLGAVHIINQREYEAILNSPTVWRVILWIQMILYAVWFIFLFTIAVKKVYNLRTLQSVLIGFIGFITYQVFFFIFNR